MNNLLVAVETNDESQHIYARGVQMANAKRWSLNLLTVIEPIRYIYSDLDFSPLVEFADGWQAQRAQQARCCLTKLAPELGEDQRRVEEGNPVVTIDLVAGELDAELVVMGLHNRHGLGRMLGSTTHGLLNHTERSVLAVHPESGTESYERVLIAVDTSECAYDVLRHALPFAEQAKSVEIVSVTAPIMNLIPTPEATSGLAYSMGDLSREILAGIRDMQKARAVDVGYVNPKVTVKEGHSTNEIVELAAQSNADLIIMGNKTRSTLSRLLLGSTTHGVLNRAPCDVMVYRVPQEAS